MILDNLLHAALYKPLSPNLSLALESLAAGLPEKPQGRYEIAGDQIYSMVQIYDTKARAAGKWEAHRRYIDIQYIVSGVESIGIAPINTLKEIHPYDPAKDVAFYEGPGQFLTLHPGQFMILYPHDAHMPQIAPDIPASVKKVVIKVAV
jgi:YhcH/YjgK/YiaL family protein